MYFLLGGVVFDTPCTHVYVYMFEGFQHGGDDSSER